MSSKHLAICPGLKFSRVLFFLISDFDDKDFVKLITEYLSNLHVQASPDKLMNVSMNSNLCPNFCNLQVNFHYHYTASFCQRYGVHYRLLSTCVGSFACPGIDTRVQGPRFLFTSFICALAGIEPVH
jgi:hypothetical protein